MADDVPGDDEGSKGRTPSDLERALAARVRDLEERLESVQRETKRLAAFGIRFGKLTVPFLILTVMLVVIRVAFPEQFGPAVARLSSGLLLGKLAAIGGQGDFLFWVVVLGTVDVAVGLFLLWNFDLLYRVPGIGPRFRTLSTQTSDFLRSHGWVRRLAFIAIVIIVIVPFQGTGAVAGSVLGRLIGLSPMRTFLAIAIGAYTGIALVLSGSAAFVGLARLHPGYGAAFIVLLIGGLFLVWRRFFRGKPPG